MTLSVLPNPRAVDDDPLPGLLLDRQTYDRIIAHLRSCLPNEGCGLLATVRDAGESPKGGAEWVIHFYPGTNVDASAARYTMDPVEILAAFRDMEANGWRLSGIVHSHPASPPTPSATDLREAYYPGALMVIISFRNAAPEMRAWQIDAGRTPAAVVGASVVRTAIPVFLARHVSVRGWGPDATCRTGAAGSPAGEAGGMVVTKSLRTRETILVELGGFAEEFRRLVLAEHDLDDLLRPAKDGGWGVVEILPHLRDWEEIYGERIHLIVEEEEPHLPAYDDALWAIERDYRGQDPTATFEQFRAMREELVAFLTALPAEAWQRPGGHGVYGSVTLQWLANHVCDHDQEHLQQALDALT